ncbi:polyprenyl synthetase family protein [Paenibacillus marinisediminis]
MSNQADRIRAYMDARISMIEEALPRELNREWDVPGPLRESMLYSLMAGGKRLRPLMVIAACESVGGRMEAALPTACAIEMIHTYSLIHDDLPAMDNDDYRRGKLTNHKVYGEAMAILAGDGLLTQAFYSVSQTTKRYGVPAEVTLAVTEELAEYAGMRGMVGGQAADMLGEQGITSQEQLDYIHLHKTSDLVIFSLRAGARIGGATQEQIAGLERYGHNIGLAFQIQDDILDVIGEEARTGKSKGSDEKSGKVTYPYLIGLEASQRKVASLTEEAKQALIDANIPSPAHLFDLADFLMNRDH